MKKLFFSVFAMILFVGLANNAMAQTRTATTTCTIVKPVSFTKDRNLSFGSISNLGGTVIIAPDDASAPSGTATRLVGPWESAKYNITGVDGSSFKLTMPVTTITVTNTTGAGGETMAVELSASALGSFEFDATTLSMDVYVGGSLIVGVNQTPGLYTNLTGVALTLVYE